jgi:hypothetical protein
MINGGNCLSNEQKQYVHSSSFCSCFVLLNLYLWNTLSKLHNSYYEQRTMNLIECISLQTGVTVLQHALQGVVACHQLVDAAIAGHHSTNVHEKSLPMIMGNACFSYTFCCCQLLKYWFNLLLILPDTAAAGARARSLYLMSVMWQILGKLWSITCLKDRSPTAWLWLRFS